MWWKNKSIKEVEREKNNDRTKSYKQIELIRSRVEFWVRKAREGGKDRIVDDDNGNWE